MQLDLEHKFDVNELEDVDDLTIPVCVNFVDDMKTGTGGTKRSPDLDSMPMYVFHVKTSY